MRSLFAKIEAMKGMARRIKRNDPRERVARAAASAARRLLRPHLEAYDKRSVWELLGTTKSAFLLHLESQFADGMSWENYGRWHVRHVVPPRVAGRCVLSMESVVHFKNVKPMIPVRRGKAA